MIYNNQEAIFFTRIGQFFFFSNSSRYKKTFCGNSDLSVATLIDISRLFLLKYLNEQSSKTIFVNDNILIHPSLF